MSEKKLPFSEELVREIAAVYGTPFHLYDEKGISDNVKRLQKAFSWSSDFHEYFAVKATPNPWIMKSLKKLGVGADCSSMAELILAETVGITGEEIVFSSNDTPDEEFLKAHELGAIINLDDISNLEDMERLHLVPKRICFRYNPGPDLARGNAIIGTPQEAKYGMTREQLIEAFKYMKQKGVKHFGIHAFLASNTVANEYYPNGTVNRPRGLKPHPVRASDAAAAARSARRLRPVVCISGNSFFSRRCKNIPTLYGEGERVKCERNAPDGESRLGQ